MSQLSGVEPPAGLWQRVLATITVMLMVSATAFVLMSALLAGALWGLPLLWPPSAELKAEGTMFAQLRRDVTPGVTTRAEVQAMVRGDKLRLYCPLFDYYFFTSDDPDQARSAIKVRHGGGMVTDVFNPNEGFMDVGGFWRRDCETPSP